MSKPAPLYDLTLPVVLANTRKSCIFKSVATTTTMNETSVMLEPNSKNNNFDLLITFFTDSFNIQCRMPFDVYDSIKKKTYKPVANENILVITYYSNKNYPSWISTSEDNRNPTHQMSIQNVNYGEYETLISFMYENITNNIRSLFEFRFSDIQRCFDENYIVQTIMSSRS
jgi:hypothetical protein